MLDEKDWQILEHLKQNSKLSTYKIARKTLIPVTTVHNRIKKLEKQGIIQKYTVIVDNKKLGKPITAYILVHYDISLWGKKISREEFRKKILELPNIEAIEYLTGRFDILLKVQLRDMEELNTIILDKLRQIPGIGSSETFFVLEEVK